MNLYQQPGSSNLIGWKLDVGEASQFIQHCNTFCIGKNISPYKSLKMQGIILVKPEQLFCQLIHLSLSGTGLHKYRPQNDTQLWNHRPTYAWVAALARSLSPISAHWVEGKRNRETKPKVGGPSECKLCVFFWYSGLSCSKLTMSLVNVSLKLWSLNMAYMLIFLLKKCE